MDKWGREPLKDEEITTIFDECTTVEERLVVAFLADTGCRVNELLRLKWEWIDWGLGKYGTLTVPVQATSGKKPKTKKEKKIPISNRLNAMFMESKESKEGFGINRTPQHIYNVVKRLAKKAGVTKKVTPHVFRHTMACRLYYDVKMEVEEIGHYLGHANGDMVKNVYLHINDEKIQNEIEEAGFLDG